MTIKTNNTCECDCKSSPCCEAKTCSCCSEKCCCD